VALAVAICSGGGYLFWRWLFVPGRGYLCLLAKPNWPFGIFFCVETNSHGQNK
jgi:hypothetical protein